MAKKKPSTQEEFSKAKKKPLTQEEFFKKLHKEDLATIRDLQKEETIDFVPTGSWVLDQIIGDGSMTRKPGGFPRGAIVEIIGDESSGKTTIALSAIRKAQEMGGFGCLLDFEQTFHKGYAEKMGLDLRRSKLIVTEPVHFQQGIRQIRDFLYIKPHIIVVDSVPAMVPKEYLEGAIDEAGRIGLQAQLQSTFLQYITKFLKASNVCLIYINQMRDVIKTSKFQSGPMEESPGGRALKYYSSVRLKLKLGIVERVAVQSKITGKAEKEPVNITIKATVIKNKIDRPYFQAPIFIRFGEGIDNVRSIIELAMNTKVITKGGAFFTFKQNDEVIIKAQGKEALWQAFNDNERAFEKLQSSLVFKQDETTKAQYQNVEDEPPDEMDDLMSNVAEDFISKQNQKKKQKEDPDDN
jgi:recombination protein RecA